MFLVSSNCVCRYHYNFIDAKHTILNITKKHIDTNFTLKNEISGIIFSKVDWTLEGKSQKDIKSVDIKKDSLLFQISVSYMVTYDVKEVNLDPKAIKYFGKANAYFNVYPYLREFITNIGQRMNLPSPLVLPLLKPDTQTTQKKNKK